MRCDAAVNSHFNRKQGHFSETEDLKKAVLRKLFLFQSETMQRKTPGRNSHYIGNKEQKHACHNKSEKTTDSRKTLTGCGFFSFLQKKYIVPQ